MKSLWINLFPYCKRHGWAFLWGALTVIITNLLYVSIPVQVGNTIAWLRDGEVNTTGLVWRLGLVLMTTGTAFVCHYLQRIFIIITSRKIEYEIRNDFFAHLMRLSPSYYDRMKTGDIISRATQDIEQVRMVIGPGIMYPMTTLSLVPAALFVMFTTSWAVTLYALAPLLCLPFLVNILANRLYVRSLRVQEHFSEFSGRIQESLAGVRVIRSYGKEPEEEKVLQPMNIKNAALNMDLAVLQAIFRPLMMSLFTLGILAMIWAGSLYVTDDPQRLANEARTLRVEDLLAFVMLYGKMFWPVLGLGWVVSVYQRGAASMKRLLLIWGEKPTISDHAETDTTLQNIQGHLEFRNLTYTYPETENPSLKNINLDLPAGKILGVVGAVGSGKSTLAHLIPRLYDPPPGRVFLDGRDVREYPLDVLRRAVGLVFQETYLFSDTIAENIGFGCKTPLDEKGLVQLATIADVHENILGFPNQYDTMLGERGINLSGGQKQRVSIARALAVDPPLLILDDAFASVDTQTEEQILKRLREEMAKRTTILISHRISTVKMADEIIVLEDGEIRERGDHDRLVSLGGLYADIYRRQLLEEAIEKEED